MKYTKGEWKATYDGDTYYIVTPDKPSRPYKAIAKISKNNKEREADAQLIALSPRMAEWIGLIIKQGGWVFQKDLDEAKEIVQALA